MRVSENYPFCSEKIVPYEMIETSVIEDFDVQVSDVIGILEEYEIIKIRKIFQLKHV